MFFVGKTRYYRAKTPLHCNSIQKTNFIQQLSNNILHGTSHNPMMGPLVIKLQSFVPINYLVSLSSLGTTLLLAVVGELY